MEKEIQKHLNDPRQLEKIYRANKTAFKKEFNVLYPAFKGNLLVEYWNVRLNYERNEIDWGASRELVFVFAASMIAGLIAKFPAFVPLSEEFFYPRNVGYIMFPALIAYFTWKNRLSTTNILFLAGAGLAGLIFINALPQADDSDTLILSCIHLVFLLWCLLGFSYAGGASNLVEPRLRFLKYNGDLLVMSALIVIAGGLMSGITIGLFSVIGIEIEEFYFQNVVVFCLPAVPVLATFLTQTNPQLVGKVSPVIARIFSPVVLFMLIVYLSAMVYAGKDPYTDREFLLIFNLLLIGVMAIVFFSLAESSGERKSKLETWILFLLSAVTVVVNGIALSAILFRISEWGITPNRLAVLGANVLILMNLLMVTLHLFRSVFRSSDLEDAVKSVTVYLPVYFVWAVIVTFLFPFFFGFS